jgi:hypothetical protein
LPATWQNQFVVSRKKFLRGVLAANLAAVTSLASAQTNPIPRPPITVYVQVSDARFDAYLYVKRTISFYDGPGSSEELFFVPSPRSKEREREIASWRRQLRSIVSAAIFSEVVHAKISRVRQEFSKAESASECWAEDYNRERRITITIIESADETVMKNEYEAAGRLFLSNPGNFTCKYTYPLGRELTGK